MFLTERARREEGSFDCAPAKFADAPLRMTRFLCGQKKVCPKTGTAMPCPYRPKSTVKSDCATRWASLWKGLG